MALQVSARRGGKLNKLIGTAMMVLALAVQPMYGLVAGQVAEAATTADLYVNAATDGTEANTYATINEAIEAAGNNNVISIGSGEYNEKVSITKNLTLRGEAGAIVNGPANSQAIEVRAQDNVLTNVTVSGLTVRAGDNSLNVINVSNGTNFFRGSLLLKDLTINGSNAPAGIGLMQTDGVTVDNVDINNAKVGVEVVGAQNLNIQSSRIENATTGIHVWNTTGYGPRNNTLNFTGNILTNNATGIKIENARNVTIVGGTIAGGQSAISAKDTTSLKVSGVTASGQTSVDNMAAIGLIGLVERAEITNNTITNASSTGATAQAILLGDTGTSGNLRYVTISGNTVQNISGARGAFGLMVNRPMSMETGAQLKFTNNIVDTINGTKWMAGVGLDRNTPNAEITGNTFSSLATTEGTPVAINVNHREGNTADVTAMTIKQNNFNTPGQLGVNYDWATGTSPAASKYIDASENYWGDRPGPVKGTSATAGQYVKYANWLCAPAPSNTLSTGDSKGCVQPLVTSVEPGQGGYISGTQRVYINVSNPEVMSGGFLQLNKATEAGNPANASRTNYPIKQDSEGRWYAEVDTNNIVALNGSSHQGDGKYLFRVEAHHKYGHSGQHPWGNYGNQPNWGASGHYFIVDNTPPSAPVITSGVGNSTSINRTIYGTAAPNTLIRVTIGDMTRETTSNDSGNWNVLFAGLAIGNHQVSAVAVDAAGNVSKAGSARFEVLLAVVRGTLGRSQLADSVSGNSTEGITGAAFSNIFTLPGEAADNDSSNASILGAQTERQASPVSTAAAVPTADGWKIFGLMWYWWLLIAAALAATWWSIAAAARRRNQDESAA